jgi:hypothetical protein
MVCRTVGDEAWPNLKKWQMASGKWKMKNRK